MGREDFELCLRGLDRNTDATMRVAADAAWSTLGSLPYSDYSIPEKTPVESALGQGRVPDQSFIRQFGGGSVAERIESGLAAEVALAMKMEKDFA
jgi:hypothetical protein